MKFDFRDKNEYIRIIKFGLVGVMNTLIDWAVFFVLNTLLHVDAVIAQPVAYSCGIISSFLGNKFFTFKAKNKTNVAETVKFVAVSVTALLISTGIVWLLNSKLGWNEYIAKLVATLVSLAVNFIGNRFFVFNKAVEKEASNGKGN